MQAAPRALDEDEQRALLRAAEAARPRDRAIVVVLLHTALRLSEVVALDVDDVRISARKGVADVQITVRGLAAHAGVEPERGRSAILQAAHSVLQAQLARELRMKRTPQLAFEYDPSVERGVRMTKLIDELAPDDSK